MINSHHTAECPNCGKDTYEPEIKAFFGVAQCPWCGKYFKWDSVSQSMKVCKKGDK